MVVIGSIRSTVREKILETLNGIAAPQKILILDGSTVKVIDASIAMPEILDTGVFLIENVALGRQPYPTMAAIYLIAATEETIQAIARDFTPPTRRLVSGRTGPCYGEAHVFFTTALGDALMQKLAQSAAAPYVRSLQELYLDFCPLESRVFHVAMDRQRFFSILYGESTALLVTDPGAPEPPLLAKQLDVVAARIASACIVMGEAPRVRYRRAPGDGRSSRLAVRVQRHLEDLANKLGPGIIKGGRGTLLIVDRTIDLLAPLLHEFTVQAMATDLVGLGPDGTRYEYTYSTIGGSASRTVSLDERDPLWCTLRHAHIADCSNIIIERFNRFMSENKAAIKSRTLVSGEEAVTSLAELKDTMAALGEFQEMKSEFALHLGLAQACLAASDQKKLIEIAGVEQDVATGLTAEGESVKGDAWNRIAALLDLSSLTSTDRARLVGIYLLANPKVGPTERRALFDHARLDGGDLTALQKLCELSSSRPYRQRPSGRPRGSRRKSCLDEPSGYDVSRYVPAIKVVAEDAIFDELDQQEFPHVKGGTFETADPNQTRGIGAISLRTRTAGAGSGGSTGGSAATAGSSPLFIYVLGGATYSEMRSVYELADALKCQVYLGADNINTPNDFLANLKSV